ncbi:MAG: hypothetical protein P8Z37_09445, partial [Acidobacteriota bacterium]
TAHFDHEGEILVLHVDEGLLRFKFNEGDQVRIHAGDYLFTTVGEESHTGELGLNSRGQIAMNVLKGAFEVLDTASGQRSEVSVSTPFAVMDQTGKGVVSGKTIKDNFPCCPGEPHNEKCSHSSGHWGGVAIPIAIKAMGDDEKSPSSR